MSGNMMDHVCSTIDHPSCCMLGMGLGTRLSEKALSVTILTLPIMAMFFFFIVTFLHLSCSLPKHKVSGQVKGFAFIEYSTAEEAKAALEVRQK